MLHPHPLRTAVTKDPESISLEPDSYVDDYWILQLATDNQELVDLALSPRALHELHLEARSISTGDRQAGQSAVCDTCGDDVDLFRALPNVLGRPVHRECYAEEYGVGWVTDYP